jgi:hypothetical protein
VKTTFHYDIGSKKFIALIDYNITSKNGKIIEMSPVQDDFIPVSVQTNEANGEIITVSNSVGEIQSINSNTQAVILAISNEYPLLKKYNISSIKVINNRITDTFEVIYTDKISNISTVITTTSNKQG